MSNHRSNPATRILGDAILVIVVLLSLGVAAALPERLTAATAPPPRIEETIVVTATLLPEEANELTTAAEVITASTIERTQARHLSDVLANVPGLHVATSGSPGHTTSVFTRGTNSNHTLVLWNGVPINGPFDGRFDLAFLPLEGVERVEVVRGPWSALYGSGLGGVINVLTGAEPTTSNTASRGRVDLEAGEGSTYRAGLTSRVALGAGQLGVHGSLRRGQGFFDNDFYDAEDATLRFETVGDRVSSSLLARHNRSDVGIPFDGAVPSPRSTNEWSETQLALPVRVEWNERWSSEALLSRVETELEVRNPDSFFASRSDTVAESLRARLVAQRTVGANAWLAFGGESARESVDYFDDFSVVEDRSRGTSAAFAQTHVSFARVTLEAGLRHDEDEHYGGKTSPRLGVVARLADRGRVFASYGESFRAPAFLDLYYPFYGNPDLDPETAGSFEIGTSWRVASARGSIPEFSLSVVGFRNEIESLIQGVPPTFLAANVGRARTEGFEASLEARGPRLDVRLSWTELESENLDTRAPLLRRPRSRGTLVASWTAHTTIGLQFGAIGRYVGGRPDFDPATFATRENPSFTRWDVLVRARMREWLEPFARVENVADEEYAEVLGFPAPRRTFLGGVALRF